MSRKHVAYKGTVVTLMPHSAYIDEWRALDKKLRRKADLEKASISVQANSYRILVRVTDEKGSFEFKNLQPGKYFIYVHEFREQFADLFQYEGNRALIFDARRRLPVKEVGFCIDQALTYHLRKRNPCTPIDLQIKG